MATKAEELIKLAKENQLWLSETYKICNLGILKGSETLRFCLLLGVVLEKWESCVLSEVEFLKSVAKGEDANFISTWDKSRDYPDLYKFYTLAILRNFEACLLRKFEKENPITINLLKILGLKSIIKIISLNQMFKFDILGRWLLSKILAYSNSHKPQEISDDYPKFHALMYSVDVFVPIIDFHQESYWLPNANIKDDLEIPLNYSNIIHYKNACIGSLLRWYLWFHIAMGWILTTLGLAGFTGLVRRLE